MGGVYTLAVLTLLNSLDELESAALSTLAPEIRDSLGVGDGAIVFVVSATSAFLVLGALPMGWLADRFRRAFGAETALGIVVLAFSGWMVGLTPPKVDPLASQRYTREIPLVDQATGLDATGASATSGSRPTSAAMNSSGWSTRTTGNSPRFSTTFSTPSIRRDAKDSNTPPPRGLG